MNALIVDDEQRYRDHVSRSLERKGLRSHAAADADAAMRILSEHAVDVMIVDIRLVDSENGLDFAARARASGYSAALIVMTGYGCAEYERRSHDLGAVGYLEKPFDSWELELQLQRAVDQRRLVREVQRLEQELAEAQKAGEARSTVSETPLACIAESGEVLYASADGQAVLDTLVSPELRRRSRVVDAELLHRLRAAVRHEGKWGQTPLFRRDGVLLHYVGLVRRLESLAKTAFVVFFVDGDTARASGLDDLWTTILLRASRSALSGSRSGCPVGMGETPG